LPPVFDLYLQELLVPLDFNSKIPVFFSRLSVRFSPPKVASGFEAARLSLSFVF